MKLLEVIDASKVKKAILTLQQKLIELDVEAKVIYNKLYGLSLRAKLDRYEARVQFKPRPDLEDDYFAYVDSHVMYYCTYEGTSWDHEDELARLAVKVKQKLERLKDKDDIGYENTAIRKYDIWREVDKRFGNRKSFRTVNDKHKDYPGAWIYKNKNNKDEWVLKDMIGAGVFVAKKSDNPTNGSYGFVVVRYNDDKKTFCKTIKDALDLVEKMLK
jgi:hypothetical protein